MSNFNTELIKALSQGNPIEELIRREIEFGINQLLLTELTTFLDYEKHDVIGYNSGNSRNGYYLRTLDTKYGEISVTVPEIEMVISNNRQFQHMTEEPIV